MLKQKKFYMVREEEDDPERLSLDKEYYSHSREAKPEEVTLESMANLLDQNAESCNAHEFVTCHMGLAALLHQEVGREAATRIFRRLANFEGLHGMLGVAGAGDDKAAARELGVPLNTGKDWKLPD